MKRLTLDVDVFDDWLRKEVVRWRVQWLAPWGGRTLACSITGSTKRSYAVIFWQLAQWEGHTLAFAWSNQGFFCTGDAQDLPACIRASHTNFILMVQGFAADSISSAACQNSLAILWAYSVFDTTYCFFKLLYAFIIAADLPDETHIH